jgi:hypothetical protein
MRPGLFEKLGWDESRRNIREEVAYGNEKEVEFVN